MAFFRHLLVASCAALAAVAAHGVEVTVAIASNFTAPMRKIAAAFEADTGHKARLAFGSTGSFYAQVRNGAPFDMLLAADDETPARLAGENEGVAASRFTYATGRLVLWSEQPGFVDPQGAVLGKGGFTRLAIANPKLAPYGVAAIETMKGLGLLERLRPLFVQGENIAQAYQFVATRNAPLGFVALSQVMRDGRIVQGSAWIVPANLHPALKQDAIILTRGASNPAAASLATYLRSDRARSIMRSYGYEN